jgi:Family of unknown function (DUF6529)
MESAQQPPGASVRVLIPAGIGAAVALAIGAYANAHDPTGESILGDGLFFSATLNMKAWLATAAILFAMFQVVSALWLYGRLPGSPDVPRWLGTAHRVSGTLAFLVSLPVAYHCLWALGFQDATGRTLVHSLAGCFFYGAFVAKVVVVESRGLPGWTLPVAGGAVFTALVVIWLTSSLWFFDNFGFPEF